MRAEFTRAYAHMRTVASSKQDILAEFDRAFSSNLCLFNPQDYIRNQGSISLPHSILSLINTVKELSSICEERASRLRQYESDQTDDYVKLSSTFWNDYVDQSLNDLLSRSRLDTSELKHALPSASKPPALKTSTATPSQARKTPRREGVPDTGRKDFNAQLIKQLEAVRGKIPLYRGKGQCTQQDCSGCLQIFDNLPLTRCNHQPSCTELGWFPHVSSSFWKAMNNVHRSPEFEFRPRYPGKNERFNPLRTAEYLPKSSALAGKLIQREPAQDAPADTPDPEPHGIALPEESSDWAQAVEDAEILASKKRPFDTSSSTEFPPIKKSPKVFSSVDNLNLVRRKIDPEYRGD